MARRSATFVFRRGVVRFGARRLASSRILQTCYEGPVVAVSGPHSMVERWSRVSDGVRPGLRRVHGSSWPRLALSSLHTGVDQPVCFHANCQQDYVHIRSRNLLGAVKQKSYSRVEFDMTVIFIIHTRYC